VIQKLSERVEALTGPDRETDMLIKASVHGAVALVSPFNGEWCLYKTGTESARGGKSFERPRHIRHEEWIMDHYTASIDAAMTLVPEEWLTDRATQDFDGAEWHWSLYPAFKHADRVWGQAGTAPLALTAAALRARGL